MSTKIRTRIASEEATLLLPSLIGPPFGYHVPSAERFSIEHLERGTGVKIARGSIACHVTIKNVRQLEFDDTYSRNRYLAARAIVMQFYSGELTEFPNGIIEDVNDISSLPSRSSTIFYWLATLGLPLDLTMDEFSGFIAESRNLLRIRLWNEVSKRYPLPSLFDDAAKFGLTRRLSSAAKDVYLGRTSMYADVLNNQPSIRIAGGRFWELRLQTV